MHIIIDHLLHTYQLEDCFSHPLPSRSTNGNCSVREKKKKGKSQRVFSQTGDRKSKEKFKTVSLGLHANHAVSLFYEAAEPYCCSIPCVRRMCVWEAGGAE